MRIRGVEELVFLLQELIGHSSSWCTLLLSGSCRPVRLLIPFHAQATCSRRRNQRTQRLVNMTKRMDDDEHTSKYERAHGSTRVPAVSDRVFAVILTLLVLGIHIPDLSEGQSLVDAFD